MKANKNLKDSIQKGTKHSLPLYGFQLPATFAKIPTWGGH